ncbi:hypothetical protein [Paenibacillus sp. SN-8-1]|uniref:hypothetical protein n=1 Tax=Paenibacillus sp. SN-8-1 TaxID=3435409 RepID=UPI003D9A99BB
MKILHALFAAYWTVLFILYLFGIYEPDGFIVGLTLFFTATAFIDLAIEEGRK